MEAATPGGEDEPATSTAAETVVAVTKAQERRQEEALKPEEVTENSETSVISEEPKEETSVIPEESKEETRVISEEPKEDPAPIEKQEEVAEEAKVDVRSSASAPTTPLKGALEDVETVPKQVSASEPVTPTKDAISKDKAVIATLLSASAPATPANAVEKDGASKHRAIPEDSTLTFKGSKVKTAMEKRTEEEQPKKKEVAQSNDMIEDAKSKLLQKRKSKVKALVGAFETVMDSPGKSS
ncbi:uncharacterized protein LOC133926008 [Phragmites australis]|uniref:uncharacterized protein LOC133926008 n=1 Tax=Phragmites australis TaxID=29695 RepID=UPI002D77A0AC|nr:uncharacterized protein LOC133926008 [Phragmites australis]